MKAAAPYNILWVAHVLPIYVVMFRLSPMEALDIFASMKLAEWVDGDKKKITMRELVKDINPYFFRQWTFQAGCVGMNACDIPDMA